jgi:GGDEF domain-containing protein
VLLGLTTVKALAVGAACGLLADGASAGPHGLWTHSVTRAVAASVLAGEVGLGQSEAFTAGLLANIGVSLLHQGNEKKYVLVLADVRDNGVPLEDAERRVFGVSHVEVGARALDSWRFPPTFVRAVLLHHTSIDLVSDRLARVVIAAGAFARFVDAAFAEESTGVPLDVVAALGIGVSRVQVIADVITAKVDELAPTLGITPQRRREGADLERDRDRIIGELKNDTALAGAAQQLVLDSTVAEVAKLNGTGVGLASFVRQALDIVTQLMPVRACALELRPEGLPPLVSTVGIFGDLESTEIPMIVDGVELGLLRVQFEPESFADVATFNRLSNQLGSFVANAVAHERARRLNAVSEAQRLAAQLPGDDLDQHFSRLALSLASLSQISGARIFVDEPVGAIYEDVSEGLLAGAVQRVDVDLGPGSFCIETYWPGGVPAAKSRDYVGIQPVADALRETLLSARADVESASGPTRDDLTGLLARSALERLVRASLRGVDVLRDSVGLVVCELDDPEAIRGHGGDSAVSAAVVTAAQELQASLAAIGCDAQMVSGGETSFVAVCGLIGSTQLRSVVSGFVDLAPKVVSVAIARDIDSPLTDFCGVSVGVSMYPEDATSAEMFLGAARDKALRAKSRGGSRVV